jgi:hypothetical protein
VQIGGAGLPLRHFPNESGIAGVTLHGCKRQYQMTNKAMALKVEYENPYSRRGFVTGLTQRSLLLMRK